MSVAEYAELEQLNLEQDGVVLHQPDQEPERALCFHCLRPILKADVRGELVIADVHEWLPRGECLSCAQTRHANPGSHVDCSRCGGSGMVGGPRPAGYLLAVDIAWGDDVHVRLVGPNTDRRRGEALYQLHQCGRLDA